MKVYLDYAATSPVKKQVLEEIMPFLTDDFGNASSMHEWGRAARIAIDRARTQVAKFLNSQESEIIFTSGGTESDNLALKGTVLPYIYSGKGTPHIITTSIEHHAVLNSCKTLEKSGVEITYIEPNIEGIVETEKIRQAIKENTVLVSVMYINNEIGTIQPIREIGQMLEKVNKERLNNGGQRIYFHTDAVQAAAYQNMDVLYLHVDMLTLSGHKIGAPKGIGALYVKKGVNVMAMMHGGEQEFQKRAGTENVSGIVALGKAVELVSGSEIGKIEELKNYFIDKIINEIPESELNGSKDLRNPNNVNVYFKYIEGESILMNLDLVGIAASSGSACTSLSLQPSHVLMAIYHDAERAHGSIRFTLGEITTKEQIDYVIENLKQVVAKLRKISPLAPKEYK